MPPGVPDGDTVGESSTRAITAAAQLPQTFTDKPAGGIAAAENDAAIPTTRASVSPEVSGSGTSGVSSTTTPTQCFQAAPQTRSESHSPVRNNQPEATAATATDVGTSLANGVRESTSSSAVNTTDIQSLWTKAANKLPTKQRQALEEIGVETGTIEISLALETVKDVLKQQKGKEWKVKFRGDDIVLSHVGMKILHWVDKFKEIGDIIVQFDPVHAALPWAGFRFLLKVALSLAPKRNTQLTGLFIDLFRQTGNS